MKVSGLDVRKDSIFCDIYGGNEYCRSQIYDLWKKRCGFFSQKK